MDKYSLSIIFPCYNEGEKLLNSINIVKDYLESEIDCNDYEIIAVNDGSTDEKTNNIFDNTKIENVKIFKVQEKLWKRICCKKGH